MTSTTSAAEVRLKLNRETARMHWRELQRYFASGLVVVVSDQLDLIDVALAFSSDDTPAVAAWMATQQVGKATDVQAQGWLDEDAQLWAVVVRPWILVQRHRPPDC